MKCNFKRRLVNPTAKQIEQTQSTVKRIWEIATLIALRREFGFGKERLTRFVDSLNEVYSEFMINAADTDKYDRKKRELSDIDTAIIRLIRELRSAGIDHRELLGDSEKLVIIDESGKVTDLDEVYDRIEEPERRRNGT